jgi:AcrR family transcriptional regulator
MGKKGQIAREKIMETAIRLYSQHGFDQTSFQMIAKELGITHTAPIYHFKNKLGLFKAVTERIFSRADEIVHKTIDPDDLADIQLLKYFQGHLTWTYIYKREADIFSLLAYFASIRDDFAEIYKDIMQIKRAQIQKILEQGQQEGVFPPSMDSKLKSHILLDCLFGFLLYRLAGRKEALPVTDVNRRVETTLKAILEH